MMLKKLMPLFRDPPLYAKTTAPFWDDEHISEQMLFAHLDPDHDGASRKQEFIDRSADWISRILPPKQYPSLLDVGCGPGLYAERYTQKGYRVTGVDISRRSICCARARAKARGQSIRYLCKNYLELSLNRNFDLATMIYCDYGALSTEDRAALLTILFHHLRPGGKLLLDVFALPWLETFREGQTWEACPQGGFWSAEKHLLISKARRYPPDAALRQTVVITDSGSREYCLWDTCFSREKLEQEAANGGFRVCGWFGDAAGGTYHKNSETIAVLLEK